MPRFDTPAPITAAIHLANGQVRIAATERADTVVTVRPADPASAADDAAARATAVVYDRGRLAVRGPRQHRRGIFGRGPAIEIDVELPAGSHLDIATAAGDVNCAGRLGDVTIASAAGDVRTEQVAAVRASSASGAVTIGRAAGDVRVDTASGDVRIGDIAGSAVIKAASGSVTLGEVAGDLRILAASGDVSVESTAATVGAKVASGSVRIGRAIRGSVRLDAGSGALDVGIPAGTAAWLDVRSRAGQVRSTVSEADGPSASDETVKVRARSDAGDILIHRG